LVVKEKFGECQLSIKSEVLGKNNLTPKRGLRLWHSCTKRFSDRQANELIEESFYGIKASKDVKLNNLSRTHKEEQSGPICGYAP
jgi:hypothetical protein